MRPKRLATGMRWAFNTAVCLSLAMLVATACLWARSYANPRVAFYEGPRGNYGGLSKDGSLEFMLYWPGPFSQEPARWAYEEAVGMNLYHAGHMGFALWLPSNVNGSGRRGLICHVPHWSACILFAVLPAGWLWRMRRARRAGRLGLCRNCGYDLRSSPVRCPECGAERKTAAGIA